MTKLENCIAHYLFRPLAKIQIHNKAKKTMMEVAGLDYMHVKYKKTKKDKKVQSQGME